MIREWLHLAWHVDGMTWEKYLRLPVASRWTMHAELISMTEEGKGESGGSGGVRPKRLRR